MRKRNYILNRIIIVLLLIFMSFFAIKIKAGERTLVINGNTITLKDGTVCKIGTTYNLKGQEFRGCWASPLTGDIGAFSSPEGYKAQIIDILETMERFNLNALLLHVRIKNDACYKSEMNAWSSYYNTNPSWDSLPWVIEECHRRGIEFHAWMNPYRVSTGTTSNVEALASTFPKNNPASNPKNLLVCSSSVILDPGIPEVRSFLVSTCMELARNYDIDAIHFDDYFYAAGCDDSETYRKYNTSGLSLDNFRREQVNMFIRDLSKALRLYNKESGRRVQLGISPTGVYANGSGSVSFDSNGNVSSSGSRTGGYAHYGSPLYADTLKWINNEWIDYILPQTYHGITNSAVPYCEITTWWNKVMARTNVNLYCAMGLYMAGGSGSASWGYNEEEAYMQAMYVNGLENASGMCIYQFTSIKGLTEKKMKGIWNTPVIVPEIKTMDQIEIGDVSSLDITRTEFGNILKFPVNDDAKFYVIYRSTGELKFSPDEVIDVIGDVSVDGVINYPDKYDYEDGKIIRYGVRCLSRSNTLSKGISKDTNIDKTDDKAIIPHIGNLKASDNTIEGEEILLTWDTLHYQFGSHMQYEVTYTYDELEKEYSSNVGFFKSSRSSKIKILPGYNKLNISVKAYNELGERIEKLSLDIFRSLGKISNFGPLEKVYTNKEIEFSFNSVKDNDSDFNYALEYSFDSVTWNELSRIKGTNAFNEKIKGTIEETNPIVYYRIKAWNNDLYSYSNVESFQTKDYLGDFNSTFINGERYNKDNLYIFNEGDILEIKIKKIDNDASYGMYYSSDGKNFIKLSIYDNRYQIIEDGSYLTYKININYRECLLLLKLSSLYKSMETEMDTMKIYCLIDYLYSEDILKYFHLLNDNTINEMNLFN